MVPPKSKPLQFKSYRELLFGDRGQIVNAMGQLEDECLEFQTDPVTNVTTCVAFRNVPASDELERRGGLGPLLQ